MSGEIVLLTSGVATGGLAVIAGGAALLALAALLQARAEQAAQRAREAAAKLAAWQAAQAALAHENAALAMQLAQTAQLQTVLTAPPEAQTAAHHTESRAVQGYLAPEAEVLTAWRTLQTKLAAIPTAWRTDPEAPFTALSAQAARLQAQLPQLSALQVAEFTRTLTTTLDAHQQALTARQARLQRWQTRAQRLLQELLTWRELLADRTLLAPLEAEVQALLAQPDDPLRLTAAEAALHALLPTLEQQHRRESEQTVVAAQLTAALESLGYVALQSFATQGATRRAQFGIPGGEQLQAAIQPDLRLAFVVAHERVEGSAAGSLDAQEYAFLAQQEARWCRDLPQLLARLDAAGIRYTVGFERHHLAERIPVVTVESAAAWEALQPLAEQQHDRHS